MMEQFQYKMSYRFPDWKIVLNIGVGQPKPQGLDGAINDLTMISGQKPIITKARKSIAGFKLRRMPWLQVTLRGERMYDFLDRNKHRLPRMRDFEGIFPGL